MRTHRLLLSSVLLTLAGCQGITGACTLIGCHSGLVVQLDRAPAGAYRIEAFVAESGPRQVFDCAGVAQCGAETRFDDFTPETVTVRVITAAGTTTQTFQPSYSKYQPNGAECGPTCRTAVVTATLPS
jgi:hypothetical protein